MIPEPICNHFWPTSRTGCDAGLRAPNDCYGCPAYYDGSVYLDADGHDAERAQAWAEARGQQRLPRATFRGQDL